MYVKTRTGVGHRSLLTQWRPGKRRRQEAIFSPPEILGCRKIVEKPSVVRKLFCQKVQDLGQNSILGKM